MSTERDLARLLGRIESRLSALEQGARTSQLQHASLTGTAITVYDEDGTTRRGTIGMQPDGTVGFVAEGGPPPGALSAPTVTPSLAGLRVVWDGLLADGTPPPADFAHAAVHVSTVDGFTPGPTTFAGTITRAGEGGMLPVAPLPYEQHYVRLTGVNTSGIGGEPSAQASGTPVRVDGPDLTAGSVTAGAIQAGAVTADKLEAILSVVNRIVAGDPAGARVELNEDGLRVYDGTGALVVQFDAASGDAVFSGKVTGADISGSTVTGGVVRTGVTGERIALTPTPPAPLVQRPTVVLYTGRADELAPGTMNSGSTTTANGPQPIMAFGSPVIAKDAGGNYTQSTMALRAPKAGSFGGQFTLTTNAPDSTSELGWASLNAVSATTSAGESFIGLQATDGADNPLTSYVRVAGSNVLISSPTVAVDSVLTSGNVAYGTTTVTPSAANTPTSKMVNGLNLKGTEFRAYATARTTVPGANPSGGAVLGVGTTDASSDGFTLWVTRTNTTDTIVNWMIVGV